MVCIDVLSLKLELESAFWNYFYFFYTSTVFALYLGALTTVSEFNL